MSDGQLAMNTNLASPGLFFKDSNGDLVKAGPVHVGTTAPNVSPASGGQAGNSKGELWLDTTGSDYTLKTWDGSAWREIVVTSAMVKDGTIVNADINASAAIAGTKISPDFGSQTISTTGTIELGNATDTTLSRNSAGVLAVEGVVIPTVSSTNTLTNKTLTSPELTSAPYVNGSYRGNIVAVAALDIDCSAGNYFTKTINANSTFTISSVPASRSYSFTLELTHTSGTVTWPAAVKFPEDTAPTLTTGKTHLFMFVTDDGGTRWRAAALVDYTN
jgi:hypothetical protein